MIDSYGTMDDAEVAATAARAGADVVRALYGQRLSRVDKGGGDFATAADLAAEEAILGVLRAARPDDGVLGEEGGQRGPAAATRRWLVDPLCGTLNYAAGNPLVAVNVALMVMDPDSGRAGPVAAAVADPFSEELYVTDGETARTWSSGADNEAAPARSRGADDTAAPARSNEEGGLLTPSAGTRLVEVNLDPPFPAAPGFRAVDLLAHPGFGERFKPRVLSTSLALAWVAAGRRAAYVTDGEDLAGSVHFAAGIALCRAAGCVVTDLGGEQTGRGLVAAADAGTHELLMSMIRSQR